jgi:hypothetical protein
MRIPSINGAYAEKSVVPSMAFGIQYLVIFHPFNPHIRLQPDIAREVVTSAIFIRLLPFPVTVTTAPETYGIAFS